MLAVPAAIIGNILCTFLLIALAGRARTAATPNRQGESAKQPSKRRQRVAKYLDRFGAPGVCLLGPIVLASQITSPALVALGANRRRHGKRVSAPRRRSPTCGTSRFL